MSEQAPTFPVTQRSAVEARRRRIPLAALCSLLVWGGVLLGADVAAAQARVRAEDDGGRMLGAGRVADDRQVRYDFALLCDPDLGVNHLRVRWGGDNSFTLSKVTGAVCRDDPAIPGAPSANFDTYIGEGTGSYNGAPGARAGWIFTGAGEGGPGDTARFVIANPAGKIVLDVSGPVKANHRAFGEALLPAVPGVDPENVIHSVEIDAEGRPSRYTRTSLPDDAFTTEPQDPRPKPEEPPEGPREKIQPILERMLTRQDANDRVLVVVSLRDDVTVPRFPDLPRGVTRESPEAAPFIAQQHAIIRSLLARRAASTADLLARLSTRVAPDHDVRVVEQFWITNAFLADVPLADVPLLASLDDVVYIAPNEQPGIPPLHDGNPSNDVAAGRARINSDQYFNLAGIGGGFIGLLDTGVGYDLDGTPVHTLLSPPADHLAFQGDCVDGGPNCLDSSNPNFDLFDCFNHGIASSAILSGNAKLGDSFRGVTQIRLDSWKVWTALAPPHTCGPSFNLPSLQGIQRAFQTGLQAFDRVFAVELQIAQPAYGDVAQAADQAFNAGALGIAANGNCAVVDTCDSADGTPQPMTVRSPANAHKVIGVGAFNVETLVTGVYQGQGPANDGRIKPDIQAPTNTETASRCTDESLELLPGFCGGLSQTALRSFGGTSGATPYAAGAAALMRNWLRKFNVFDPGQAYSRLILSGDRVWSEAGDYSNVRGAGHLRLPGCGSTRWGKVSIHPASSGPGMVRSVSIPIEVSPWHASLEAALWWPEAAFELHDDIDVYLLDPDGIERARGYSKPSVFERTRVVARRGGLLKQGTWTVKITGYHIVTGPQTVYWTADARGCPVLTFTVPGPAKGRPRK